MKRVKFILTFALFLSIGQSSKAQWSLTGNSGITPVTNFIGTTDSKSLRFRTNNTERMIIDSLGNTGIGVPAPTEKLHVDGKIRFGTTSKASINATTDGTNTNINFGDALYGGAYLNASRFGGTTYSTTNQYLDLSNNGVRVRSYTAWTTEGALDVSTDIDITTSGWKLLTIKNHDVLKSYVDKDGGAWFNSSVGIGTTNVADTNYKLFVEKGVRTRKVKVDQSSWADYVFHPEYKLRSLMEVEQFIRQNNHLPEVPSAREVEQNGVDLGESQVTLLKKIEELYLYTIEQEKRLKHLEKQIQVLKQERKK